MARKEDRKRPRPGQVIPKLQFDQSWDSLRDKTLGYNIAEVGA
jgi:hypothetical protein